MTSIILEFRTYCEYDDVDSVKKMYKTYNLDLTHIRHDNNYVLRHSCKNGAIKIAKYLVSLGLTLDDIRSCNNDALIWSGANGYVNVVQYLMSCGLNIDDIRTDDIAILKHAYYFCHTSVVKYIESMYNFSIADISIPRKLVLRFSCEDGNSDMIRHLLDNGLTLNDIREYDNYAIMISSALGYFDIVKYLIDKGLTRYDILSCNALKWSYKNEHHEIFRYLCSKYNIDLNHLFMNNDRSVH